MYCGIISSKILSSVSRIEGCFRSDTIKQNPFEFEIVPVKDHQLLVMSSDFREVSMPSRGVISTNVVLSNEGIIQEYNHRNVHYKF